MKYAVKFFLDTDGFTNWDDDQIEDPDITFTIVRFPSIEEAKKAVNQDFIDFRDNPGFYSNDTVRSCNGRWLVANDMKMFGGTAVPGEEEGFAVSYEVSGDCDYASMIIESVSPASEEDETHMESDLEEGCIEGVFICEDSHCNTEQSQKYTGTDSDPFLVGRSLDNYLSDCNELGLLPAIDDIYERYGADGLEKAASMVRLTYYNDEMVSTIPNYLEAGYDLEKIKEYALISPSIAYELQSYIATINDNDEEEKYSEDLYRFCSVEMKQNNEKYEYTWCGWYIEEDLVNDLMFAVEQIEDNDNDDDYIGALKRIIRLWQPEMFTKYGLNKMAEQLIELLNSEYLEEFWDDPDFYFKQYLKEYANFVKDLIPILNEYVAKGSVDAASVLTKALRAME